MSRFKVVWWTKGRGRIPRKRFESEPGTMWEAHEKAQAVLPVSKAVTILKEDDGSGHPDNKGKWFLFQIVK